MKPIFGHPVLDGMAALFWNSAWADYQDELFEQGEPHANLSGVNIYDVSDDPDERQTATLKAHVTRIADEIETVNNATLDELVERAGDADDEEADPERFGECLAYMSMGSGVSWFDDHEKFPLEVPYHEFGWVYLSWPPTLRDQLDAWVEAVEKEGETPELKEAFAENGKEWVLVAMKRAWNQTPRGSHMICFFPDPDDPQLALLTNVGTYRPGWGSTAWEDKDGNDMERPEEAEPFERVMDELHVLLVDKLRTYLPLVFPENETLYVNHHGVLAPKRNAS